MGLDTHMWRAAAAMHLSQVKKNVHGCMILKQVHGGMKQRAMMTRSAVSAPCSMRLGLHALSMSTHQPCKYESIHAACCCWQPPGHTAEAIAAAAAGCVVLHSIASQEAQAGLHAAAAGGAIVEHGPSSLHAPHRLSSGLSHPQPHWLGLTMRRWLWLVTHGAYDVAHAQQSLQLTHVSDHPHQYRAGPWQVLQAIYACIPVLQAHAPSADACLSSSNGTGRCWAGAAAASMSHLRCRTVAVLLAAHWQDQIHACSDWL